MRPTRQRSNDQLRVSDDIARIRQIQADDTAQPCEGLAASFDLDPMFGGVLGEVCSVEQLGGSIVSALAEDLIPRHMRRAER